MQIWATLAQFAGFGLSAVVMRSPDQAPQTDASSVVEAGIKTASNAEACLNELERATLSPQEVVEKLCFTCNISMFNLEWNKWNASKASYYPEFVWKTDFCTGAPNRPMGCDFTDACRRHDFCYGTLHDQGRFFPGVKRAVDQQFHKDMKESCAGIICTGLASVYFEGVRAFGHFVMPLDDDRGTEQGVIGGKITNLTKPLSIKIKVDNQSGLDLIDFTLLLGEQTEESFSRNWTWSVIPVGKAFETSIDIAHVDHPDYWWFSFTTSDHVEYWLNEFQNREIWQPSSRYVEYVDQFGFVFGPVRPNLFAFPIGLRHDITEKDYPQMLFEIRRTASADLEYGMTTSSHTSRGYLERYARRLWVTIENNSRLDVVDFTLEHAERALDTGILGKIHQAQRWDELDAGQFSEERGFDIRDGEDSWTMEFEIRGQRGRKCRPASFFGYIWEDHDIEVEASSGMRVHIQGDTPETLRYQLVTDVHLSDGALECDPV